MRLSIVPIVFWVSVTLLEVIYIESTQEILRKPYSLIYFGAFDCQYCEQFNPDFEFLSTLYNGNEHFQAVKVDGRKNKDLVKLFDVHSFPTLKLYDQQNKQVYTYNEERVVERIQDFIQEKTGAVPDHTTIKTSIHEVSTTEDVDLFLANGPVVLAFVSKMNIDWNKWYYPAHYYQQIARDHPNYAFLIVFTNEAGSDIIKRYHVSNVPSLVFVDKTFIKVHNSFSTNQITNQILPERAIRDFIGNVYQKDEGAWFEDLNSLYNHTENLAFEGHKQWKGGMNVVESREDELVDEDEEYLMLVEKIGL